MVSKGVRFANLRYGRRLDQIRDRLADIIRSPKPTVTVVDEEGFRNERHVFLFGVCGRSSTTALMRMFNSTRSMVMWGEPGDYVVDDLLRVMHALRRKNENPEFRIRKEIMTRAFRENDHKIGHAMAFPELSPTLTALEQALLEMFRPVIDVKRVGFKEITVRGIETLEQLKAVFPASSMVYLFRDPLTQWPSVEKMGWKHLATLEMFLADYERLAEIYMQFGGTFIETTSLRDKGRLAKLAQHLELAPIDERLINDGVFAMKDKKPLSDEARQTIERSGAFTCYRRMQALERGFFDGASPQGTQAAHSNVG